MHVRQSPQKCKTALKGKTRYGAVRTNAGTRAHRHKDREKAVAREGGQEGIAMNCRWRRKARTTRTGRMRHAGTRQAPTNAHGAGARTQTQARSGRRTVASERVGDGGDGNFGGDVGGGGNGSDDWWW